MSCSCSCHIYRDYKSQHCCTTALSKHSPQWYSTSSSAHQPLVLFCAVSIIQLDPHFFFSASFFSFPFSPSFASPFASPFFSLSASLPSSFFASLSSACCLFWILFSIRSWK